MRNPLDWKEMAPLTNARVKIGYNGGKSYNEQKIVFLKRAPLQALGQSISGRKLTRSHAHFVGHAVNQRAEAITPLYHRGSI
jgi:hypothetical protein